MSEPIKPSEVKPLDVYGALNLLIQLSMDAELGAVAGLWDVENLIHGKVPDWKEVVDNYEKAGWSVTLAGGTGDNDAEIYFKAKQ